MTLRWVNRPKGSNWGDFGPDDELGRLNLLTPERVRRAVEEVREGRTFCLSLPLDYPGGNLLNPRRHPPQRFATIRQGKPNYNFPLEWEEADFTDVVSDDAVLLHTQYSTQWDALSHVGGLFDADGDGEPEVVYYNGWRGGEHVVGPSEPHDHAEAGPCSPYEGVEAKRLGIQNMAQKAVQGRGVLVDLRRHLGDERTRVGYDQLMRVMEADDVRVEEGDLLCLHTGFADVVLGMRREPDVDRLNASCAALDGRDRKLQEWIADSGIACLIADNYAVEDYPAAPGEGRHPALPLHELCLFKLGIHLGELWYLTDLAAWLHQHRRSRFLLTAPPLRLPGAVGSPATPVATV